MSKTAITRFITPVKNIKKNINPNGLSIIIIGGGVVKRMKSYGPQSLLEIDKTTILDRILENINLHFPKDSEVILTIGFEADKVIKKTPRQIRIIENQLYEELGELEEARLAINNCIYDNVLIMTSDLIFNRHTLDNIRKKGSAVIVDSKNQIPESEIGVTVAKDKATIFAYEVDPKWANIAYLTGKEFDLFKNVCSNRNNGKWFLFEGLNAVIKKRGKFHALEPKLMKIKKITSSKDIV